MRGDDGGQLLQRLDLVADHAAHRLGRLCRLLGQFEDAALQFAARRIELALHFGGHVLDLGHRGAELLRRLIHDLAELGVGLIVGLAQRLLGALALARGVVADRLELARRLARRALGGDGELGADLFRARLGGGEVALHRVGEFAQDALELLALRADLADERAQRIVAAGEGGVDRVLVGRQFARHLRQRGRVGRQPLDEPLAILAGEAGDAV